MAKMLSCELIGLEEIQKHIEGLAEGVDGLLSKALFEGAKVMADGLKAAIQALPEDPGYKNIKRGDNPRNVVTAEDKADLLSEDKQRGMGISRFQKKTGQVYARIGFKGYGTIKTKAFPQGRPLVLIARSINSGSSVRVKHPFIKPTINKYKQAANDAMRKAVKDALKKTGG